MPVCRIHINLSARDALAAGIDPAAAHADTTVHLDDDTAARLTACGWVVPVDPDPEPESEPDPDPDPILHAVPPVDVIGDPPRPKPKRRRRRRGS